MSVIVRFAPSPTGFLHIGGARTALFNWLFARHHQLYGAGGDSKFLLRIEDTDRVRSTPEAVAAIIDGLSWLGLEWDGEIVYQSARATRHAEAARQLLELGRAYHCYCTPAELEAMRERARAEKRSVRYDGTWRDRDPAEAQELIRAGIAPVIRLKAPQAGATTIRDLVQGEVTVANAELDDLILLRADGTPTYNLSVVVDDHDMGVTHVIRGDDHLNNAFRQTQIYRALDWAVPQFAHVPLIHGPDGAKMSKRHGAIGVEQYRELGYLPEALRNYLLRLGWSHGDDEIISTDDAVRWFDIADVGRAAARFDKAKLDNVNAHYIREADDDLLLRLMTERLEGEFGRTLSPVERERLTKAMPGLKPRAKTIVELVEKARRLLILSRDQRANTLLDQDQGQHFTVFSRPTGVEVTRGGLLPQIKTVLESISAEEWPVDTLVTPTPLSEPLRRLARSCDVPFGRIAQLLGAAVYGSPETPGLYIVLVALGRDETLARIADAASGRTQRE
ncbi:MAG TPA: glutamate--tRNA ligase [Stellaceae bacterium]|nr:glutamate--tRNA ligase [Stellaceae bacterium]